jgi:hypothetical protein
MIESFYLNSRCSDIIILTQKGSITDLINSVDYDRYEFVSVTNDDFVYKTEGWDEIFIDTLKRKGGGIAFGNDGSSNKHLPSTCIMSRLIPDTLGWIQLPELTHLCGDMVWQYIGQQLNAIYYHPQVNIEHMHYLYGKADAKDYEYTNSRYMYLKDNDIFQEWLLHKSYDDINKIKERLFGNLS